MRRAMILFLLLTALGCETAPVHGTVYGKGVVQRGQCRIPVLLDDGRLEGMAADAAFCGADYTGYRVTGYVFGNGASVATSLTPPDTRTRDGGGA